MYTIDDLLVLASNERAEELKLHVGGPPIMVIRSEHHTVEGPKIATENMQQLFQNIVNSRQWNEFQEKGAVVFLYTFRDGTRFLVRANVEGENIGLDLERQTS